MTRAAVVCLLYARPDTTQRLVDIVRAAKPSRVLVVADGPRDERDAKLCAATRDVIASANWECEVLTNYADTNLGLKRRVETGLDWAFSVVDEAIVLEDDCLAPDVLPLLDELLEQVPRRAARVSISGDTFVAGGGDGELPLLALPAHLGWATWRRAWRLHDAGASPLAGASRRGLARRRARRPARGRLLDVPLRETSRAGTGGITRGSSPRGSRTDCASCRTGISSRTSASVTTRRTQGRAAERVRGPAGAGDGVRCGIPRVSSATSKPTAPSRTPCSAAMCGGSSPGCARALSVSVIVPT